MSEAIEFVGLCYNIAKGKDMSPKRYGVLFQRFKSPVSSTTFYLFIKHPKESALNNRFVKLSIQLLHNSKCLFPFPGIKNDLRRRQESCLLHWRCSHCYQQMNLLLKTFWEPTASALSDYRHSILIPQLWSKTLLGYKKDKTNESLVPMMVFWMSLLYQKKMRKLKACGCRADELCSKEGCSCKGLQMDCTKFCKCFGTCCKRHKKVTKLRENQWQLSWKSGLIVLTFYFPLYFHDVSRSYLLFFKLCKIVFQINLRLIIEDLISPILARCVICHPLPSAQFWVKMSIFRSAIWFQRTLLLETIYEHGHSG